MRRAIYEDDVIKLLDKGWKSGVYPVASNIHALPSAQTEINKEELKRTIRAGIVATNTKDVYSCGMRNGMRWCKALLEDDKPKFEDASLYAQPEQRWIPVTEMLPKEEVDVLVAVSHDTVMIAWIDDGHWTSDGVSLLANVKAWMPLQPYKEDEG